MDSISRTVICVCATMVLCSALTMLVPSEKYEKIMRLIMSAAILCCLISGAASIDIDFPPVFSEKSAETGTQSGFDNAVTQYAKELVSGTAEQILGQAFENAGIEYQKIDVEVNTSDSGSISIEQVTAVINDIAQMQKAIMTAKDVLGTEAVIIKGE